MARFRKGDRVRIDIPDKSDPDYERFHGTHGTIVKMLEDDGDVITGEEMEGKIYRVEFGNGKRMDFRSPDLRPPIE